MSSNDYRRSWFKKNNIAPKNNQVKNLPLPPPSIEIIKLSTVNRSGIYMPPSPSDQFNSNEDYFGSNASSPITPTENFQLPFDCVKLTSSKKEDNHIEFYTPSSHLQ